LQSGHSQAHGSVTVMSRNEGGKKNAIKWALSARLDVYRSSLPDVR